MTTTVTRCYPVNSGTCSVHGTIHYPNPGCSFSYVVSGGTSPALTTVTMVTRRSPLLTVSPLPGLPTVGNFQDGSSRHSPSPVIPILVLTTPTINPLVVVDSELRHHKVHYDASKHPSTARAKFCGRNTPISREQMDSLVVEGALHRCFRVMIDHPALTRTIDFKEGSPTVGDFLTELYSHLQEQVGSEEKLTLEGFPSPFIAALKAQMKRCEAAPDFSAEWKRGMKRIDVLGEECKFRGVYLDSTPAGDYLVLNVLFGK